MKSILVILSILSLALFASCGGKTDAKTGDENKTVEKTD
jgi:hypothetical protein